MGILAEQGQRPEQEPPPDDGEALDPESSPEYVAARDMAMERLYEGGVAEGIATALQSAPDIATGLSEQTLQLLQLTDEASEGSIPDELYMALGMELMGEVAEIAQAAEIAVGGREIAEAMRKFMGDVVESLGGDATQIRDAMASIDPATAMPQEA